MGEEDIKIAAASNGKAKCSKSETKGLTGPLAGLTSAWGRLEHPGKGRASRRQEGSGRGAGSGADPCLHPRAGTAAFNPAVRVVQRSALRGGAAVPPPAPCGGVAAVVMERAALLRRVPPAPPRRPRPLSDAAPSCPPAARPVPPCPGRGQSPWRGAAAGRPRCRAVPCRAPGGVWQSARRCCGGALPELAVSPEERRLPGSVLSPGEPTHFSSPLPSPTDAPGAQSTQGANRIYPTLLMN